MSSTNLHLHRPVVKQYSDSYLRIPHCTRGNRIEGWVLFSVALDSMILKLTGVVLPYGLWLHIPYGLCAAISFIFQTGSVNKNYPHLSQRGWWRKQKEENILIQIIQRKRNRNWWRGWYCWNLRSTKENNDFFLHQKWANHGQRKVNKNDTECNVSKGNALLILKGNTLWLNCF